MLPASSTTLTASVLDVPPRRAAVGCQRIWNGNDTFRLATGVPFTVRRASRMSPRSSVGLDLDLDRVGDVHGRPPPRAAATSRSARRCPCVVGSRWLHHAPHQLVADRRIGDLLEPEPTATESRVEMIAPPFGVAWPA